MPDNLINYSTKAKAHELTLLKLKSLDLLEVSPTDLSNKYLEIYDEIYNVLDTNRLAKKKKL